MLSPHNIRNQIAIETERHPPMLLVFDQQGRPVNHAGFDDVKENLLDNERHHKKGRECGSCIVLMMSKRNHLIVIIKKGENVNV